MRFKGGSFLPNWIKRVLRLARSTTLTREGKWYIAIVLITGAIAINTGNNLLYLVLATLLSLIIISGLMSEFTLKGLKITRSHGGTIFKGAPFSTSLHISNNKRIIPSLCFRVYELPCDGLPDTHSYVVKVGAKATYTSTLSNTCARRGLIKLDGFKISTAFPFGLFLKTRRLLHEGSILVYPSMPTPQNVNIENSAISKSGLSAPARGSGTELYNIREYTQNDDARHIHWKSAARSNQLMVKEFEKESARSLIVTFNNLSCAGAGALFEDRVDEAAGMINHYLEKGWSVGLETLSGGIGEATGTGHLYKMLEFLALIKPAGTGIPSVKARRS